MKKLIRWHQSITETFQRFFKLSDYQMLWIAFIEGLLIAFIISYFI